MDFRTAVLEAAKQKKGLTARQCETVDKLKQRPTARFPRVWKALEATVANRYKKQTGKEPPTDKTGAIDWSQIMQWLVDNLPTILKMIMSILVLF